MIDANQVYGELNRLLGEQRFTDLYQTAEDMFLKADLPGHNWEHIKRVIVNSVFIGLQEGADMQIVLAAAILHDIGFVLVPDEPKKHHLHGADRCVDYLGQWTPEQQEKIAGCIKKHKGKFPGYNLEPSTLEEKVLCDADQVDKFGWIGLFQSVKAYMEYGLRGVEEYKTMEGLACGLAKIGSMVLYTGSAKEFARAHRDPSSVEIAERLRRELGRYTDWSAPSARP